MTPEIRAERIAIVQDALTQITEGRYLPERMVYVNGIPRDAFGELKEVLLRERPICTVCAVGALFLSEVRRNNEFDLDEAEARQDMTRCDHDLCIDDDAMRNRLEEHFDHIELSGIEAAFEYAHRESPDRWLVVLLNYILDNDGDIFDYAQFRAPFDPAKSVADWDAFGGTCTHTSC